MNVDHFSVGWVAAVAFVLSSHCALGGDEEPELGAAAEALIEVTQDSDPEVRLAAYTVVEEI